MGLSKIALPAGSLDAYPWDEDIAVLIDPLTEMLRRMWALGYERVTGNTLGDAWSLANQRASEWARTHAAELVRGIDAATRDRLAAVIADAQADPDMSIADLTASIEGLFGDMAEARAELIAVTETAYAAAAGDAAGYRETGVEYVEISDGTESDEECADADGQVWSLDAYEAEPLAHPNCGRSASAIDTDEALSRGIDRE